MKFNLIRFHSKRCLVCQPRVGFDATTSGDTNNLFDNIARDTRKKIELADAVLRSRCGSGFTPRHRQMPNATSRSRWTLVRDGHDESSESDLASTAKAVLFLYDKYDDPTNKSQDDIEQQFVQLLLIWTHRRRRIEKYSLHRMVCPFERSCQDEFLAADKQRTEEKMAKETGAITPSQTEAKFRLYRELVDVVNALVLVEWGDAVCRVCRLVNVQIADKKAIVKLLFHQKAPIKRRRRESRYRHGKPKNMYH